MHWLSALKALVTFRYHLLLLAIPCIHSSFEYDFTLLGHTSFLQLGWFCMLIIHHVNGSGLTGEHLVKYQLVKMCIVFTVLSLHSQWIFYPIWRALCSVLYKMTKVWENWQVDVNLPNFLIFLSSTRLIYQTFYCHQIPYGLKFWGLKFSCFAKFF